MSDGGNAKYLHDHYLQWCGQQGVPIVEDFGIDMGTVETGAWDFFGLNGAICHLKGRDDYISMFCFELPAGAKSRPIRHIYEEVFFVLSGNGSTTVESPDGRKHTFEWGPNSLFSVPLNATFQHFNGSGRESARLASTNNFIYICNLFRNMEFIFENPVPFPERLGDVSYFAGEGEFNTIRPGRHQWETNFVPDLTSFDLPEWAARGKGNQTLRFELADGTIGCHTSEMPKGTYKKGHLHMNGVNVCCITGKGYSLLWYEGDTDFHRIDWHHGVVYSPPDQMFHQHFNIANEPSRYLATQMGTTRYPLTQAKKDIWDVNVDKSVNDGGAQIEYADQDPRIHEIWLDEAAKSGVESRMEEIIAEAQQKKSA